MPDLTLHLGKTTNTVPHGLRSREQPTGLQRYFSLRTYGCDLADEEVRVWQVRVIVLIVASAIVEAAIWAYCGWVIGESFTGLPSRVLFSVFVFVVAIIFLTGTEFALATLDFSGLRRQWGRGASAKQAGRIAKLLLVTRLYAPYAVRVAIVAGAGLMTGPLVATMVFETRIVNEAKAHIEVQRDSLRATDSLVVSHRADSLRSLRTAAQASLEQETSGLRGSRSKGCGPTCRQLLSRVQTINSEIQANDQLLISNRHAWRNETRDAQQKLKLDLSDRLRILWHMQDRAVATVEALVWLFLSLVYFSLVTQKMLQPESVGRYYNARLQDLYRRYMKGAWAVDQNIAYGRSPRPMTGLEFETWLKRIGMQLEQTERDRDARGVAQRDLEDRVTCLKDALAALEREEADRDRILKEAMRELREAESAVALLVREREPMQRETEDARKIISLTIDHPGLAGEIVRLKGDAIRTVERNTQRLGELEVLIPVKNMGIETLRTWTAELQGALSAIRAECAKTRVQVVDEHRRAIDAMMFSARKLKLG
jgi:hypothetical protein